MLVPMVMAIPLVGGGPLRRICVGYCLPSLVIERAVSLYTSAPGLAGRSGPQLGPFPLVLKKTLPEFPAGGIEPGAQPSVVPGARSVNREQLVPAADPSRFAYVNTTSHFNLYRISLP